MSEVRDIETLRDIVRGERHSDPFKSKFTRWKLTRRAESFHLMLNLLSLRLMSVGMGDSAGKDYETRC